jgi:hypothetical protein
MGGEANGGGRSEPEEGVAVACAGVAPVALVADVVGVEPEGDAAVIAAGSVARAEVEDVGGGDADGVVARCFFPGGVAPAGHEVKAMQAREGQVGKEVGVEVRDVEDLLVVVGGRAGVIGDGAQGGGGAGEAEPVGGLAFGVELDACVGFTAFGLEARIAGAAGGAEAVSGLDDLRIEERGGHAEEGSAEENALAGLEFCADFGLAGVEGGEELIGVIDPPGGLGTEREKGAVVRVDGEVGERVVGDGVLREPDGLGCDGGRSGGGWWQ